MGENFLQTALLKLWKRFYFIFSPHVTICTDDIDAEIVEGSET